MRHPRLSFVQPKTRRKTCLFHNEKCWHETSQNNHRTVHENCRGEKQKTVLTRMRYADRVEEETHGASMAENGAARNHTRNADLLSIHRRFAAKSIHNRNIIGVVPNRPAQKMEITAHGVAGRYGSTMPVPRLLTEICVRLVKRSSGRRTARSHGSTARRGAVQENAHRDE